MILPDPSPTKLTTQEAHGVSAKSMKKTWVRKKKPIKEETMRAEYRFDYSKSKPNRFAEKLTADIISAMPSKRTQGGKRAT